MQAVLLLHIHRILIYLGTLPFLFFSMCHVLGLSFLAISPLTALVQYASLIAVFINGAHWTHSKQLSPWLALTSNAQTLIVFFGTLFLSPHTFIPVLALCYLALVLTDWVLYQQAQIDTNYLVDRIAATLIVLCSLLIGWLT